MNDKVNRIITFLSKQQSYVSVATIGVACKMSKRSVYYYLNQMRDDNNLDIEMNRSGVRLLSINRQVNNIDIPNNYKERRDFILRKTLIQYKTLNINDLINYLCISESTFRLELLRLRQELSDYSLKIITKNNKLYIQGKPEDRKKLTLDVIYHDFKTGTSPVSLSRLQILFEGIDVRKVKDIITEAIEVHKRFLDEYSLINLLLHILVIIIQHMNDYDYKDNLNINYEIDPVINCLCKRIENDYHFIFSDDEKALLSLFLVTRQIDNKHKFESIKHQEALVLYELIITSLLDAFNINLDTNKFKMPFIIHLDNLIERLLKGVILENPLLNNIKLYSPITYDIAIFTAKIISDYLHININESEIAYIALHLGTQIEEIKNNQNKLKTIIVCPQYFSFHHCKLKEIGDKFKDDIYILNIYTNENDIKNEDDIDLIISTVSICDPLLNQKAIHISDFLNNHDRLKLAEFINYRKKQLKLNYNRHNMESIFDRALFYDSVDFKDKDYAIKIMADKMIELNYVKKDYKTELFKREEIAPTDFNNVAIPHPVDFYSEQTKISVAKLVNPIKWGKNKVDIIFMMSFNFDEIALYENIFSLLAACCNDAFKITRILNSTSYEEFIDVLIDLFNINN